MASYTGVLLPLRARLTLVLFTPFFRKINFTANVDGALKFPENDIINF